MFGRKRLANSSAMWAIIDGWDFFARDDLGENEGDLTLMEHD